MQQTNNEPEAARSSYAEALEICRELAAQNPAAYRSNVAGILNNLAVMFIGLKDMEQSIRHAKEAIEMVKPYIDSVFLQKKSMTGHKK